jgi:hypothetical protein
MTLLYPLAPSQPRPDSCSEERWEAFWPILTTPNSSFSGTDETLAQWSQTGWLDRVLPEWQRQRGPLNTQHQTHDFPLDVHSLKVIAGTKQSQYYQALSPEQKTLTVTAALFHDIAKNGGRPDQRLALIPDGAHPTKAVMVARRRLPTWGFTVQQVEWVCRLVKHHQLMGRLIMRYSKVPGPLPQSAVTESALQILCEPVLDMLLPLTEGDIRGVKAHDALFTDRVAEQLHTYSEQIRGVLRALELQRVRFSGPPPEHHTVWLHPADVDRAMDGCACAWPLQEDNALIWARSAPFQPKSSPAWLPATVLPEHCLWTVDTPLPGVIGVTADSLRRRLLEEKDGIDWPWFQPMREAHPWRLVANPILEKLAS